jgi:arylsulfatase A-like enzyme
MLIKDTNRLFWFLVIMAPIVISAVIFLVLIIPGEKAFYGRVVHGQQRPVEGCNVLLRETESQVDTLADGNFIFYESDLLQNKIDADKMTFNISETGTKLGKQDPNTKTTLLIDCPGFALKKVDLVSIEGNLGNITVNSPNIVLILWDDLGYGEVSAQPFGQTMFSTPGLDKLAAEGMKFTDFYAANAMCSASRGGLMTGKHPGNATIRANLMRTPKTDDWRISYLLKSDTTVAQTLQNAGYKTGLFGKWHLDRGDDPLTMPHNKGFDEVLRERWDKREHRDPEYVKNYPFVLWDHGKPVYFEENRNAAKSYFLDDINTDYALDFIRRHQNHPFFLFLSYKTPHAPLEYAGDISALDDKNWPELEKKYVARITRVDDGIDRLTRLLDELEISRNTLVLVTSDNGPHNEGGHKSEFFNSNGPLRGTKSDLYEGGIRVPTLARWTGRVQPGTLSRHPAAFWDLMATAVDVAGVEAPANDGLSFLPELLGKDQPEHSYLYWERHWRGKNFSRALRMGNWKAVQPNKNSPIELYDLATDIGESNDLSSQYAEITRTMEFRMNAASSSSPYYPLP